MAAGLGGVLLMHHSVHRPLAYGWLAAGALTVVVAALAVYALIQRGRVSALRERLTALERTSDESAGVVAPTRVTPID